jgi:hypothetical protein
MWIKISAFGGFPTTVVGVEKGRRNYEQREPPSIFNISNTKREDRQPICSTLGDK